MAEADTQVRQAWEQAYLDPPRARELGQQIVERGGAAEGHGWLVLALVEVRTGDAHFGLEALEHARALLEPQGDLRALALCDEVLAIQLRRAGDCMASMHLQREVDARDDLGLTPYDRFIAHNSRAITHKCLGQADEALRHFYDALDAAQASGLAGARVIALCNLGGYHQDLFNLDDARALSEQALQAAREAGAWTSLAMTAANLIVIHHAAGQADEARAMAEVLLAQRVQLGPAALQRCALPLALGCLVGGDLETAQRHLDQGAVGDMADGDSVTFWAWLQARCWLARGEPQRARELATRTLHEREPHRLSDPPYDQMELHRAAADACEQLGDTAAALACVRRAQALYEQLVGRSARARFIALRAGHELATAQRERDVALDSRRSVESDHRRLAQLNDALQAKITETHLLHAKLQEQAVRDPLTGLHNRRYLFEVAPGLLELARRNHRPLCVALLDLDHFKLLNDNFGHQAGDTVLQRFAALMPTMLRRSDVICRYGGEEFVAVMPDIDADGADAVLQRLLDDYQALQHELGPRQLPRCSFSAGIAIFPKHGHTLEQLLSRADRALYTAKNLGRARIEKALGTDFSAFA